MLTAMGLFLAYYQTGVSRDTCGQDGNDMTQIEIRRSTQRENKMTTTDDVGHDSTSGFVNNWQSGKSLAECNQRMLSSEDSCDVTFKIGTDGHVTKAHRYILRSRSCMFHKLLSLPEEKSEEAAIGISDIELGVFSQFLTYLYTDATHINSSNVHPLLKISRRYAVSGLEGKCVEYERNENKSDVTKLPIKADNWQAGKSLADSNLHMFMTEDGCDVTFRVGSDGYVIKAHSYVLKSRSCVFHSLLTDPPESTYQMDVPDMSPSHFKHFLVYLYTENTTINSENATALLHASRKYAVCALEKKCLHFLEANLNIDNACDILETSYRYEYEELYDAALAFVKLHGQKCLRTPGFLRLSKDLVDEIIKSHNLVAFNHVIFSAIDKWSEQECHRQGREVDPKSKRAVLGSSLEKIAFNLDAPMIQELRTSRFMSEIQRLHFGSYGSSEKLGYLLSELGTTDMAGHLLYRDEDVQGNPEENSLANVKPCVSDRRYITTRNCYNYYGLPDAIVFRCNKEINLHGFQLYGPLKGTDTYDLMTNILDDKNKPVMSSVFETSCTATSSDDVFDVMYKKPVDIKAGKWYTLLVKILGPDSKAGHGGLLQVFGPDDVLFDFRNSDRSKNGTSITVGQIPAFLYSVH